MKRNLSAATALLLCLILAISSFVIPTGANEIPGLVYQELWNGLWQESLDEIDAGIIVAPGQYESERCIAWYSAEFDGDCTVSVSLSADMSNPTVFTGSCVKTPQGDLRNEVIVTGLEGGKTYYFVCKSGDFVSSVSSINTVAGNDFSAMYVTDVHISADDADKNAVRDDAFVFNSVIGDAMGKQDISLILSAGDQASDGLREEYIGFAAGDFNLPHSITTAITIGNHDKKNIDYKYFNCNPETDKSGVKSYIGSDYWFVKGDALFCIMDSNNADADFHRSFIKSAVKANPDVKWRVAMMHHDLFGGRIEHRESENELLRLIWCPLFDEFAFDLVLLGHSHYYTVSDVIYGQKSVADMSGGSVIDNAEGTVYMVSGSLTRPRTLEEGEIPPLGENIGYSYLTNEPIYNILTFSESSIEVNSYILDSDEAFNSYTLTKNTQQGGHPNKISPIYNIILRFIGKIVAIFGNIGCSYDLYEKYGIKIPVFEAIFG